MPDEFLTIDEVAAVLKISPRTVYRLTDSGEIPFTQVGGQRRIPSDAIDEIKARAEREAADRQREAAGS